MFRVLLTSFEPFDSMVANSSLEIGRELARRPPRGVELEWLVLPVVAGACVERAWARIEQMRPGLTLSLGQASGASSFRIECRAVNENHFRIPDNAGNQVIRQAIVPCAPSAYASTTSPGHMAQALAWRDFPVQLSFSAGKFVCNHLYFGLLHRAAATERAHQTAFIHLPLLPCQVRAGKPTPSMGLKLGAEGVRRAIVACVQAAKAGKPCVS